MLNTQNAVSHLSAIINKQNEYIWAPRRSVQNNATTVAELDTTYTAIIQDPVDAFSYPPKLVHMTYMVNLTYDRLLFRLSLQIVA